MNSLALRWTTFGLFVAMLVVAVYLITVADTASRAAFASADNFDRRSQSLTQAVLELRMAQQAYVAAGQGDEFWGSKVAAQIASLREELAALRSAAATPGARAEIAEAVSALDDFERMDARAREYTSGNQRLLASDLIFSDGLEKTAGMVTAIQAARTAEIDESRGLIRAGRQRELLVAGAAGAAALALGFLMVPIRRAQPEPTSSVEPQPVPVGLMLRDARDPLPPPVAETLPSLREAEREPADPFDLGRVASLCSELARVVDTRALPGVLEATASVLDANGVVLWIADPDGRELNPIVTHGYPAQLVTRLGTIPRDAPNATAAAFRTALLQIVESDAVSNGAIAVPLVTPSGCVGVMSAEVRHGGEKQDAKLAAAAIVGAQLATLVGPPSSRPQERSEAAAGASVVR
jgi:hypothetical protein